MRNIKRNLLIIIPLFLLLTMSIFYFSFYYLYSKYRVINDKNNIKVAQIVANGDILYHDVLYWSARENNGNYNFDPYFEYVRDRISGADLAIGDYEGTISDRHNLSGYPLFNAPKEAAQSMKNIGYDVVDLAHNHILDTELYGLQNTYKQFNDLGLTPIGVYVDNSREESDIVVKEVNGIKIAFLAYAYGFNGLESNISQEQYNYYMSDLNEEKMKKEIETAEKIADITVIMPQMGVEYSIYPTDEQKELYRKMIDWGADVVLGGHPHVVQPAEIVEKDGDKKLIIYSMGNFISNQTYEMMSGVANRKWTERGVLMDITFEKDGDKTIIKKVKSHPTMVIAKPNGNYYKGYPLFDYRVIVIEDFLSGGKYYGVYSDDIQQKIERAYKEMNDHVGLVWE